MRIAFLLLSVSCSLPVFASPSISKISLKMTADQMECRPKESVCYATGNALAVQGGAKDKKELRAHRFTVRFTPKKQTEKGATPKTDGELPPVEISTLMAEQGVVFIDPENELVVKADQAKYHLAENRLELTGNVKITRGSNQLSGSRGTVDLNDGVFKIYSNGDSSKSLKVPVEALILSTTSMKNKS